MNEGRTCDVCVVGGGISGASFAYRCAREGARVVVLEREAEAGGCIRSFVSDDSVVELGAHTLTNRYQSVLELIDACGLRESMKPLDASRFALAVDDRQMPILRRFSFLSCLFSIPTLLWNDKQGKSLRDYYGRVFGKRNYEQLLRYAFQAVLSQPADDFPAELLFKKRPRNPDYLKTFTLEGGLSTLIRTLLAQSNIELITKAPVKSLLQGSGCWEIRTSGSDVIVAKSVALAIDPLAAAKVMASAEPPLSQSLSELGSASVRSVLVAVKQNPPEDACLCRSLIGVDQPFTSALRSSTGRRTCYVFHFPQGDEQQNESRLAVMARALHCAADNLEVLCEHHAVLPVLTVDRLRSLAEIATAVNDRNIYLPCNYLNGLSLEDCCQQSHKEFKRWRGLWQQEVDS